MTPGEAEQARAELGRAEETLRDAEVLLVSGSREGAASRLYYAAFHAARAALTVRGFYARTHSGQISLFERTFGAAPLLGQLLELRAQADYAMEPFAVTGERLREVVADVSGFIARCRAIVDEAVARGPDQPDPLPDH